MKLIALLVITFLFTGCTTDISMPRTYSDWASEVCDVNEGWSHLTVVAEMHKGSTFVVRAHCRNGAMFSRKVSDPSTGEF